MNIIPCVLAGFLASVSVCTEADTTLGDISPYHNPAVMRKTTTAIYPHTAINHQKLHLIIGDISEQAGIIGRDITIQGSYNALSGLDLALTGCNDSMAKAHVAYSMVTVTCTGTNGKTVSYSEPIKLPDQKVLSDVLQSNDITSDMLIGESKTRRVRLAFDSEVLAAITRALTAAQPDSPFYINPRNSTYVPDNIRSFVDGNGKIQLVAELCFKEEGIASDAPEDAGGSSGRKCGCFSWLSSRSPKSKNRQTSRGDEDDGDESEDRPLQSPGGSGDGDKDPNRNGDDKNDKSKGDLATLLSKANLKKVTEELIKLIKELPNEERVFVQDQLIRMSKVVTGLNVEHLKVYLDVDILANTLIVAMQSTADILEQQRGQQPAGLVYNALSGLIGLADGGDDSVLSISEMVLLVGCVSDFRAQANKADEATALESSIVGDDHDESFVAAEVVKAWTQILMRVADLLTSSV